MTHLSIPELADLAGVSRQAIHKTVVKSHSNSGYEWNGIKLKLELHLGQGGNSGKQYLVAIESLPEHLQERLRRSQMPLEAVPNPGQKKPEKITQELWWSHHLQRLLSETMSGSERKEAIMALTERTDLTDWHGRPIKLSRSQIYSHLKALREGGFGSQARRQRSDKGQRRCYVSRQYDASVPFDDGTLAEISHNLKQQVRGYLKRGTVFNQVRILTKEYLIKETITRGFNPSSGLSLDEICNIPHAFIREEKRYKNVYRFRKDKKAHYDASPSIMRNGSKLLPMEVVIADIHHGNWLIRRENGTTATAKLIAFMDWATRRVWCELIYFEKNGGVRNVDDYEGLARMWSHPAWGICQTLYVDNGGEYNFVELLNDAMQLAFPAYQIGKGQKHSHLIKALPYNSKAKPIEAWFGQFNTFLRHAQGYIGDDRMKPKTDKIGKLPAPTPTYEFAEAHFFKLLKAYEFFPQPGFGDKSPAEIFGEFVKDGWAATLVDPADLAASISVRKRRKVRGDTVSVKGQIFHHNKLAAYDGETVIACVPKYHAFSEVRIEDAKGNFICNAASEIGYSPTDERGAKASFDRKRNFDQEMIKMDRETPNIDVSGELIDFAERQKRAVVNHPRGTVSMSGNFPPASTYRPKAATNIEEISVDERDRRNAIEIKFQEEVARLVTENAEGSRS
ncbi:MAG: Mu transposase C-terminal domain-containing protein [Pseudomonadota bacterium]